MPKRTDLKKICLIGAGPIIIGQACEFDYSGTQACKALREEGYEVVLLNSNPATIMTDVETADHVYVEPVTPEFLAKVLRKERPDALLPTLGGQTGLNTAFEVAKTGILEELGIELIGADAETIARAEDRDLFKQTMKEAGIALPKSGLAHTLEEAEGLLEEIGLPCIIRPAFTLGGTGGGVAYNIEEFRHYAWSGIKASLIDEILIEESLIGWKEYELEVMRDSKDNVVIVCSIENLDPMGVHTGDSITVAPVQTLTDQGYQHMRDESIRCIRAIGVETGGCNIQWAVDPQTGRMLIIEMNPRVSRSSALASKATGFPIAKIAAKVAVGYTLDEIRNDITWQTPACFEPTIDYCVVKIPRFNFEKFPGCDARLTTAMKSVGEVMAFGRTFKEALQKGLRSMEVGRAGLGADSKDLDPQTLDLQVIHNKLTIPGFDRLYYIRYAIQLGMTIAEIHELTAIDPWYLENIKQIVEEEAALKAFSLTGKKSIADDRLRQAKRMGFSDKQLGKLLDSDEETVRTHRIERGIEAVYKLVDTCAAEFEAYTPYYYSTYEEEDETRKSDKPKVMILGGGPNRIGQGIEFDYCCVHASFAARELDYESIMVNCNPETVSTDYDTSDRLFFEPLTVEDVLAIIRREEPEGLIVQFGGQTPLNIAAALQAEGAQIFGTPVEAIARAEDRAQFKAMLQKLKIQQAPNATSITLAGALKHAAEISYPVIMRPSFVLGGAKMEIVYDEAGLCKYWEELLEYCTKADMNIDEDRPILIDKYLEDAVEVDVDAISDTKEVYVAAIMEHIEQAGIHSGDSACALPPFSLSKKLIAQLEDATTKLALELGVCGLMNVQYAIKDETIYVLEVNPRASRTVPYVSKVTGVPVAKMATKVMLGKTLKELGLKKRPAFSHIGVKEAVLPFNRFPGVDCVLGPEMKSTGEVMGIDDDFGLAYAKSQIGAGMKMPTQGVAFLSVKDVDKKFLPEIANHLQNLGFGIISTTGTHECLKEHGIASRLLKKVSEGRPNIVDLMIDGMVQLVINTPSGKNPKLDEISIRTTAMERSIPLVTTVRAAKAVCQGIEALQSGTLKVKSLQEYCS
ncbi:MAG: carbamoyl-phosphate synthase large subunit [Planctomycetes bacterium]|nr:carbamoyl-phosphate synthase large subunit [Planctomycetota bacterium]